MQTNLIYGYLAVVGVRRDQDSRHWMYDCICKCGGMVSVRRSDLESGHTISCGCIGKSVGGLHKTPTYWSWMAMNRRCYDKKFVSYPLYGGRGIEVCDRWRRSTRTGLVNFVDDMGMRPEDTTLDRKNPYGNYEADNCRWATKAVQEGNKRRHYTEEVVRQQLSEDAYWDDMEKQYLSETEEKEGEE